MRTLTRRVGRLAARLHPAPDEKLVDFCAALIGFGGGTPTREAAERCAWQLAHRCGPFGDGGEGDGCAPGRG